MNDLYREFADTWRFHEARIERRTIDALVGMAAGIAGDGIVTEAEALFLRNWMQENLQFMDDPVVNILYRRLRSMLADHCLDAEEAAELLEILRKFAGVIPSASQGVVRTGAPSSLPVDDPEPPIECSGKVFVFTGVMAYGPRKICEAAVLDRGGSAASGVSKKVSYLVIGSIGNEQWRHSSHGVKIVKAVDLRDAGAPIAIISEDHWQKCLFG